MSLDKKLHGTMRGDVREHEQELHEILTEGADALYVNIDWANEHHLRVDVKAFAGGARVDLASGYVESESNGVSYSFAAREASIAFHLLKAYFKQRDPKMREDEIQPSLF